MKNTKRIICLALALVLVFAMAGCKKHNIDKQVAPEGQNLSFESQGTVDGASTQAWTADGWKEQTQTNAMASYSNGTASVIVTWVDAPSGDVSEYINNDWKTKRMTETEDFTVVEEGTYTLDGTEFKTVTYTGTLLGSIKMKYTFFFAIIDGHLYEVSVGDLAENFDERTETYYAFLDTAKFN